MATIDGTDLLIADIPGLIEGAAEGKGLGHDFLRHVDRTAVLLHLVDVYNNDAGEVYRVIRGELEKYSDLAARPEIVALTKCEGVDEEIIKMQMAAILNINPEAKVFAISSSAHMGLEELLRALKTEIQNKKEVVKEEKIVEDLPVIKLDDKELKETWNVERLEDKFVVTGEKIEKFARRTDFNNYASVNRLRDIMKKMGIRAELTSLGAEPDSIISIAGREFTLVEDW
jgi:GTP-binding protein